MTTEHVLEQIDAMRPNRILFELAPELEESTDLDHFSIPPGLGFEPPASMEDELAAAWLDRKAKEARKPSHFKR